MKVRIYRGTEEIGGSCVEIIAENNKKLWIDLGLPLSEVNPDVSYRFNDLDALLISHPHSDHFGLMESVGPNVPVYIGSVSLGLINATRRFLNQPGPACNFQTFKAWKPFRIADTFTIHPFLVDHSSPEGYAFIVEADGKRLFYTGDFRSTGRKGKVYTNMLKRPPTGIDIMLTEGTLVERDKQEFPTEKQVEAEITKIIAGQENMTFVISSAQNLDRFCSVFTACLKHKKKLIIDIYTALVLEVVSKNSPKLPTVRSELIRVYSESQIDKIQEDEFTELRALIADKKPGNDIFFHPEDYVYFLRCPNPKLIEKIRNNKPINLIYSQWLGYLKDEQKYHASKTINNLKDQNGINFRHIHTSGHATMEDIFELTSAINPTRIIPIHTNNPAKFREYFIAKGVNNVECWKDGVVEKV